MTTACLFRVCLRVCARVCPRLRARRCARARWCAGSVARACVQGNQTETNHRCHLFTVSDGCLTAHLPRHPLRPSPPPSLSHVRTLSPSLLNDRHDGRCWNTVCSGRSRWVCWRTFRRISCRQVWPESNNRACSRVDCRVCGVGLIAYA